MWAANGQVMQVFSGHTAPVTCGGFTPDGKAVITGSEDSTIIIWDPKTGAAVTKFTRKCPHLKERKEGKKKGKHSPDFVTYFFCYFS